MVTEVRQAGAAVAVAGAGAGAVAGADDAVAVRSSDRVNDMN